MSPPAPLLFGPLLFGHRGSPKTHLENTLASFSEALERGLDGLETDAQPTKDGRFLIHHDPNLPDGRLIVSLELSEIIRDFPQFPSLENLFEWALKQRDFHLNLELKNDRNFDDGREARLVEILERLLPKDGFLRENLVISCFNPLSLEKMSKSGFKLGFLYHTRYLSAEQIEFGWTLPLHSVHPHHTLVSDALLERATARHFRVLTWTVNEPDEVLRLARAGVDGIIGDYPEVLKTARAQG